MLNYIKGEMTEESEQLKEISIRSQETQPSTIRSPFKESNKAAVFIFLAIWVATVVGFIIFLNIKGAEYQQFVMFVHESRSLLQLKLAKNIDQIDKQQQKTQLRVNILERRSPSTKSDFKSDPWSNLLYEQKFREVSMQIVALDLSIQRLREMIEKTTKLPSPYPPPSFFRNSIQSAQKRPAFIKALYPWLQDAHQKRDRFFDSRNQHPSLATNQQTYSQYESIRYTVPTNKVDPQKRKKYYETGPQSYANIIKKFDFKHTDTELPICVIVMHYNNNASFRIQSNMNSIFLQNYTNYKVIIIDDASHDGTPTIVQNYLNFHNISQTKAKLVINPQRLTGLENLYLANLFFCEKDDIVATVDGDDELIGINVFNLINGAYQTRDLGVAYGQIALFNQKDSSFDILGDNQFEHNFDYSESEKRDKLYRKIRYRFSNLRTYRTELFRKINKGDLLDNGQFLQSCYDQATMYAMLQMSCGHFSFLNEVTYMAHRQTGLNDGDVGLSKRLIYKERIRNQTQPYACLSKYERTA